MFVVKILQEVSTGPGTNEDIHSNDQVGYDPEVNSRHYNALSKEQRKTNPNKAVINKYLNLEFLSRRRFLEETPKEERPKTIFETYPYFKDPCEVCIYNNHVLFLMEIHFLDYDVQYPHCKTKLYKNYMYVHAFDLLKV